MNPHLIAEGGLWFAVAVAWAPRAWTSDGFRPWRLLSYSVWPVALSIALGVITGILALLACCLLVIAMCEGPKAAIEACKQRGAE